MIKILASDGIEASAAKALEAAGYEVVQQFYPPEELAEQVSLVKLWCRHMHPNIR